MVGIVVTLLVLLVDASIKSRSDAPIRTLSSQNWVDQVMPILGQTISQGDEINQLRNQSASTSATTILPELQGVVSGATRAFDSVQTLKPPPTIAGASGLLVICLKTRVQGAQALYNGMNTALTGSETTGITEIQQATSLFSVADQAYSLFLQGMPSVGVTLPKSVWLSDPGSFSGTSLSSYLETLRNARSATPVHDLVVAAISTTPPAVSEEGSGANVVQILPLDSTMIVKTTVGDLGNQAETNALVTASLQPSAPGYSGSQSAYVSLQPGGYVNLSLPQLEVPEGVQVTLTVAITPANGETNIDAKGASKSIVLLMPSPNAPVTTTSPTTTGPTSTTTATGTSSGSTTTITSGG